MNLNKIDHLEIMERIARENQLNPLYEQVLREYDEAILRLNSAQNKLAQAVKITDYDTFKSLIEQREEEGHLVSTENILRALLVSRTSYK